MGLSLLRGERHGRGALDRRPAGVFLVLGPLGLAAAARPEQPLGDQQGDGRSGHVQVGNADREQIVQVVNDAVIAVVDRAAQAALQV